jgi:hypothetical protein
MAGSAFADNVARITTASGTPRLNRRVCYTTVGGGVPTPCDRFVGPIATTASPIDIYGRKPRNR